jgi:hypothetical protein
VRPPGRLFFREHALLLCPEGIELIDTRQDCKIPGRRRRSGGPFQSAAVPWIACRVAELLTIANGHHELDDLADNSNENDDSACLRDQ